MAPPAQPPVSKAQPSTALGEPVGPEILLRPLRLPFRLSPWTVIFSLGAVVLTARMLYKGAAGTDLLVPAGFAAFAVGGLLLARRSYGTRASVQFHQRGVVVRSASGRRAHPFAALTALKIREAPLVWNGDPIGLRRWVVLALPQGETKLEHLLLDGEHDVAGNLIMTLLEKVSDAAEEGITAGRPLRGDGWRLDAVGLRCPGRSVPRGHIASVGLTDDGVLVWATGQAEPVLTVPAHGPNAMVLLEVLSRHVQPQAAAPSGLGRLLFRRSTPLGYLVFALMATAALSAGVVYSALPPHPNYVSAGGLSIFAATALLAAWALRPGQLRAHERGVAVRRWFTGEVSIRDEQVERISYVATAMYTNGIYGATQVGLDLGGAGNRLVSFRTESRKADGDLEALKDRIAEEVAERLLVRVARGEAIPFGELQVERCGVRLKSERGLPGRLIALEDLRMKLEEGTMHLEDSGGKKLASIPTGAVNFYPCLLVLGALAEDGERGGGRAVTITS